MNARFEFEKLEEMKKSEKALSKAQKIESKRIGAGYRYVRINNITKVLVECDENGEPTAKGQRTIDSMRRVL